MSEQAQSFQLSQERANELLQQLSRKQGNWVEWGKACQQLQKAGYDTQSIFEQTGFQPVHQNQLIVAAQVYDSLVKTGIDDNLENHFRETGSDILYEFRILSAKHRVEAAMLAVEKNLDQSQAHEIAKAIKNFADLSTLPEGFEDSAADAVAHHYWKLARSKKDAQARSRLIGQGLGYAQSNTAREQLEQLLSDFTVVPETPAPTLPLYRLEQEDELPRILPVISSLQVSSSQFQNASQPEVQGTFSLTQLSGEGQWVALPGWHVILTASDPVTIPCQKAELPKSESLSQDDYLAVIDRGQTQWHPYSYFIVEQEKGLAIQWFEQSPNERLLGKVILILRPKKIVDESAIGQGWDWEE